MFAALLRCLVYFTLLESILADTKRWTGNTNWETKKNWDRGDVPCSADRVLFEESTHYSVFVGADVVVSEIVFPLDGSLILDDGVSITFSNDTECDGTGRTGGDTTFIGGKRKKWYDVNQWETISKVSSHQLDVDLPLNRIPCEHDDVVFPDGSAFSVSIDREVTVKSFLYRGVSMPNGPLQTLLQSDEGKHQFQLIDTPGQEASLTVSGESCEDKAGCHCGNHMDDVDFVQEECRNYVHDTCPRLSDLSCEKPFIPASACCHVCGSFVQVTISKEIQLKFDYETFKKAVYAVLERYNTTGAGIVRLQPVDAEGAGNLIYSIFFLTAKNDERASAISRALKDLFTDSGNAGFVLQGDAVKIRINIEKPTTSTGTFDRSTSGDGGNTTLYIALGVAGGVVLILVVVVVVLVVQRRSNKRESLSHRHQLDTSSQLGDKFGAVSFMNTPENAQATLEGFDNPMYGEPIKTNPIYDVSGGGATVVNPVFLDDDE